MSEAQRKILADMTRAAAEDGHYDKPEGFVDTRPNLVTWIREQIAEDERVAQAAETRLNAWAPDLPPWESARYLGKFGSSFDNFVARHNPAAVLAQCEAHTAILAEHHRYDEGERAYNARTPGLSGRTVHPDPSCVGCGTGFDEEPRTKHVNECPTLRALALAYQHRPGYREEWRP